MTDNEIVKALEICSKYTSASDCIKCPLKPNCDVNMLETFALDLINRQKAEIERLKKGWKADVILTAEAKSEAYKEFAEKFVTALVDTYDLKSTQIGNIEKIKNNLLKELVGDENEGN